MALPVFHPCQFDFEDIDFRRVGSVTSGGTSLSGIDDTIETDGGGFWRLDLTNGETLDRKAGLAWRALTEGMDNGSSAVIVLLCSERLFQPVGDAVTVDHSDGTPFSDDTPYDSSGAEYTTTADAALRAVTLEMAGVSELPLIGGELFSIEHPTWGWRVYRITRIDGDQITFRPPLREAVPSGTSLEFDTPRCQMRMAQGTSNPTNMGRFTACSLSMVEDMRKPAGA
jgi:hypothetical protein